MSLSNTNIGADLKERKEQNERDYRRWSWTARQLSVELAELPIPTIAAIDGAALGGGMEISLSCDIRVAGIWRESLYA